MAIMEFRKRICENIGRRNSYAVCWSVYFIVVEGVKSKEVIRIISKIMSKMVKRKDNRIVEIITGTVAEYSATVLQNPIISKLYILKQELTPKILCETVRILLTILKIIFIIRKNAIYYGGIRIETKRYN